MQDWDYVKNEGPSFLWLTTSGTQAQIGDSGIGISAAVDGMYRNYAFELEGMDAFLGVSGGRDGDHEPRLLPRWRKLHRFSQS